MTCLPLLLVSLLVCATDDIRPRILDSIQAALQAREPSLWGAIERGYELELRWTFDALSQPVVYKRRLRSSPDGDITLIEIWEIAEQDLPTLCSAWGHPDQVHFENLLGEIPHGRILASARRQTLTIIRDYPISARIWRTRPFPLERLPTLTFPGLANADSTQATPVESDRSALATFFSEVFLEELLDREGVPISISKHWHFEDDFSRISPFLRIERRIRLSFAGSYTVFDIYTMGGEFILGERDLNDDQGKVLEIGPFVRAEKRIVVIRRGFETWFHALFARPFPPSRLPYSAESLRTMPADIRFVFPSTTGLFLGERHRDDIGFGRRLPLRTEMALGFQGTFFTSISRTSNHTLDLKFGGRIERFGELDFRIRPVFDGNLDPKRAFMGTLAQWRTDRTHGTRMLVQRSVDLNEDQDIAWAQTTLQTNAQFNGLFLGLGAIVSIPFTDRLDSRIIDQFVARKLPDIPWEHAFESHYRHREDYLKLGTRLWLGRYHNYGVDDDWSIRDLVRETKTTGRSVSFVTRKYRRIFSNSRRLTTQVWGLTEHRDAGKLRAEQFLEIVKVAHADDLDYSAYRKTMQQVENCIGPACPDGMIRDWPPRSSYPHTRIGFRILLIRPALDSLAQRLKNIREHQPDHPISRWLRFHPFLARKLKKQTNSDSDRFVILAKFLFKLAKSKGPLFSILEGLPESHFALEWQCSSAVTPHQGGELGFATLTQEMIQRWLDWEELGALEDIFVEAHFGRSLGD